MSLLIELTKKLNDYAGNKFLLAVSGGLDSMALFHIFLHFRTHFNFNFSVAYFHHGPTDDPLQLDYRFNAYSFVKEKCREQNVEFFSNYEGGAVDEFLADFPRSKDSEAHLRDQRYRFFYNLIDSENFDLLVLAHHRDDLLETRLIRLMRGSGPEGLEAMSLREGSLLRPLLDHPRAELSEFLRERQQGWLDDPSNEGRKPLRNWVRKKWLKDLEEKQPGASGALARSLDLLVQSARPSESYASCFVDGGILLSELLCLSVEQKRQVVATYMRGQGLKNYGLSHVNEVLKRLDNEKRSHTFRLLGRCWIVDAGRMSVQRPT